MPFTAQKKIFEKLAEYADKHHLNEKEHEQYENSLWIARDNLACMEASLREAKQEAKREVQQEAKRKVRESFDRGMEKGSFNEKLDSAKRFLAMGLTPEQVAQGTDLPLAEVLKLAQGD